MAAPEIVECSKRSLSALEFATRALAPLPFAESSLRVFEAADPGRRGRRPRTTRTFLVAELF
jgi:hypothetical protein